MNICQRMSAVMTEVGTVEKDKTNSFQHYEYASEFAIKKALQPLLIKYGVLFSLSVTDQTVIEGKDSKGQDRLTTLIDVSYQFTNIDEPADCVTGKFRSQGQDSGDKGIYKAITGAIKYILTSSFLIPTGEDPEEASQAPVRTAATAKPSPAAPSARGAEEEKPVDGTYEVEVKDVKYGTSKAGKDYELVYTDSGRMFNNSGITMPVGRASVTVANGSIRLWAPVQGSLDLGEPDMSDIPF